MRSFFIATQAKIRQLMYINDMKTFLVRMSSVSTIAIILMHFVFLTSISIRTWLFVLLDEDTVIGRLLSTMLYMSFTLIFLVWIGLFISAQFLFLVSINTIFLLATCMLSPINTNFKMHICYVLIFSCSFILATLFNTYKLWRFYALRKH